MAGYVYVKLDVDYQSDPKIMHAGYLAELVYVRSLALAKRTLLDGHIAQSHLTLLALGIPGKPERHAAALVDAGLWQTTEGGWLITSWAKHNKSRQDIDAHRARKAENGARGAHEKWHTDPSKANASCVHCMANGWLTDGSLLSPSHTQTWPKEKEETKTKTKEETEEETSVAIVSSGSGSPERPVDDDDQWVQTETDRRMIVTPPRAQPGTAAWRAYRARIEGEIRTQTRNGTQRPTGPARNRSEAECAASSLRALELAKLDQETA